jgi:hypothetical protein
MKIGTATAASFRVGNATPSKIYLGTQQVWSDVVVDPPGAVRAVAAVTSSTQQSAANISWTAPLSDGGGAISGHKVYYSENGGATWTLAQSGVSTPYTLIVPYRGGRVMLVRVTAVNSAGEGATDPTQEPGPTFSDSPPSMPKNLTATSAADYNISLSWTAPDSQSPSIDNHEIEYSYPAGSTQYLQTGEGTTATLDFTSMEVGREYTIRVRAINGLGEGEWSAYAYATVATTPQASSVSASTSTTAPSAVTLSMLAPNNGGSPLTSYDVEHDSSQSFSGSQVLLNFTDHPASGYFDKTITGLPGNQTRYFRVRFNNAIGNGDWISMPVSAVASAPLVSAPAITTGSYASNSFGTVSGEGTSASPLTYSGVNGKYSSFTVTAETLSSATLTKTGGGTTMAIYGSAPFTFNGSQVQYDYDNERYGTPIYITNNTHSLVFPSGSYTVEVYNCGGAGCNVSFTLAFS